MTTLMVDVDTKTVNYINSRNKNTSWYLSNLIKEDMLLNDINESKNSGINKLNSLRDLDN
jgi:hypothetical protein